MIAEVMALAGAKGFAGALGKLAAEHAARAFAGKNEEKIRTDIAPHIEATFQRCTSLKTLLNPQHPANFLSVYSTQRFSIGSENMDEYGLVDLVRTSYNRPIVTGTGGAGKSMFMKYLWISLFVESHGRVPIFVELRSTNNISHNDIIQYIYHSLSSGKSSISQRDFKRRLYNGDFVVILDGFDELAEDRKDAIQNDLIDLGHAHPELKIIVSSRPDDNRFSSWANFHVASVQPLLKSDLVELIQKAEFDLSSKTKFLRKIKDGGLYESHKSFLSNPLLASMMLLTFSHNFDIPDTTHLFYEQAFDALYQRHDSHKTGGYKREFATTLSEFEFKRLLSYLCLITYFDNKFEFSKDELLSYISRAAKFEKYSVDPGSFLSDIEHCVCMLVPEGLVYTFPHRSFQEYFAAYCLAFVTQNRFADIIITIGKRNSDQTVRLLSEMNPESFRENFLLPMASDLEEEIQLGVKKKSATSYMSRSGIGFQYHFIDKNDPEKFIITLTNDSKSHDYLLLIDKVFPKRSRQYDRDGSNDKELSVEIAKAVGDRRLSGARIRCENGELQFQAIPSSGKRFLIRKNYLALVRAFSRSDMNSWLLDLLNHSDLIVSEARVSKESTSDAMDELFNLAGPG